MQLMTAALRRALPPLYSQEHVDDPVVVAKWFDPCGSWTWYATEASAQLPNGDLVPLADAPPDADVLCFGWVDGTEPELGYFSLAELAGVKGRFGLGIERDLYWRPRPLSQVRR